MPIRIPGHVGRLPTLAVIAAAMLAAAPAASQQDAGSKRFRIGMLGEAGSGHSVNGLSRLRTAFERALGTQVEVFVARDYTRLVEAQVAGRLDYAIYSASAYAAAWRLCQCVEPVAAPRNADGSDGMRSVLIARNRETRTAVPKTVSGPPDAVPVIVATALAPVEMESADDVAGLEALEARATASEAVMDFASGGADAIIGWMRSRTDTEETVPGGTIEMLTASGMEAAEFAVVWSSPAIPFGPHAVRSDIDAETKRRLSVFLANLFVQDRDTYDLLEPGHDGGFVRVAHESYGVIMKALEISAP